MKKYHNAENVAICDGKLKIKVDGFNHEFALSVISERLAAASDVEQQHYQVSYGIHWPLIDEDLSIDGLLGIKHSLPNFKNAANI
ncbi:MAG: DUF2442 domain-containing protein [Deferribacteres bacterium]|nr:DUF2442 domain-containing protein [candidate division KSB1 bacterium]MCB9508905.1 DUF2442 domain-containing protein [Deferribacteres bacterium]